MEINTTFESGRLTVYLTGELDHHAARSTGRAIDELLDEYLPKECALNMAGLNFMDSSGIAVIIRTFRRVNSQGGRLWLEDPGKQARKVLEAADIDRLVTVAVSR